jgi:hypothetical protein
MSRRNKLSENLQLSLVFSLLVAFLGMGCSASGTLSISIEITGQDARDNTHDLRIFTFRQDPDRGCQELWALDIPNSIAQSSFSFQMDIQAKEENVEDKEVSVGTQFIVVYATDAKGTPFLRGCKLVTLGSGETSSVTIKLDCVPGEWKTCIDDDGDGVSEGEGDCDDDDPCRAPTLIEARTLCGHPTGFPKLTAACLAQYEADGREPPEAPYCGDGLDQDCDGSDILCATDADCDGYINGAEADCDDAQKTVNPGAIEIFDGIDNNCNGTIDEGFSCDVDGDGHAAIDSPDYNCEKPKDDPDDMDASIHPNTTVDDPEPGNLTVAQKREGGYAQVALRGFCSYEMANNGKKHREIDHDGDGNSAEQDGCPTIECDADGDGFSNGKPGCEVDPAIQDCDDEAAFIFPGAPEVCGDQIRQDCTQPVGYDAACTNDSDGDKYDAEADCDDKDPKVHPWATEICNGIDDDCDGLIDEGNPNHDGLLQPTETGGTAEGNCTDDNDGKCGEKKGYCVCSTQEPSSIVDPGNNLLRCEGEDLAAKASPRCFGAGQSQPEVCDNENPADFDCDGDNDVSSGKPFADSGRFCGTDVGPCVSATVTACRFDIEIPDFELVSEVLGGQKIEINRYWSCTDAIFPEKETKVGDGKECRVTTASSE